MKGWPQNISGTVTGVDEYFTHMLMDNGEHDIVNHLALNAVPKALRKEGQRILYTMRDDPQPAEKRGLYFKTEGSAGIIRARPVIRERQVQPEPAPKIRIRSRS